MRVDAPPRSFLNPAPPPTKPTRARGTWRVGDVVVVTEALRETNLGEGAVLDVGLDRHTSQVKEVLVRFDHGPKVGVWYGVGTVTQLRDIFGKPIG